LCVSQHSINCSSIAHSITASLVLEPSPPRTSLSTGLLSLLTLKVSVQIFAHISFETEIDLSQFISKEITLEPDENGECDFFLPKTKKKIKFRYLTADEDDKLVKEDEARRRKLGTNAISQLLTMRLAAQITEIEGTRDRAQIQGFIDQMPVSDSGQLRKYINDNEPGLDLDINIQAPSGEFFFGELPITTKFLWPYLDL
jgi:hypothetical protein